MGKFGKLFDRYDDTVKVTGGRRDFPTCTVVAVCDKVMAHQTDDDEPRTYLKAYWTVLSVERGEVSPGAQHTVAFFKSKKAKFFERDTKRMAAACRGLDEEQANALKKVTVAKILEEEAPGQVIRLRCIRKEQESKKEEGKTTGFTNVEYLGRLDRAEVMAVFEGDKKTYKKFFPQGLDETGRGKGFGEDEESEEPTVENENESDDENEAPRRPAARKPAKAVDLDDDSDSDEDE